MEVQSILQVDEFVRSINVNKASPHALLLGAGASLSSGVPSAGQCVEDWKKEIFVTNNPTLKSLVADQSVQAVKRRIDAWLKTNGHWPAKGDDDYSFFIERCHPISEDRRKYFAQWIQEARPHVGYQLLCVLAQAQIVRSVWTTNFDSLTSTAAATTSLTPIEIGIECQHRAFRQPSTSELPCVSMHGDYRYDDLKNTNQELISQEDSLKEALINTLATQSLIVMGYSGRDASVMATLEEALCCEGPTKLYWCGYSDTPSPETRRLIESVRKHGRYAFYVPNADFDNLMIRLATVCITNEPYRQSVAEIVGSIKDTELPSRVPFAAAFGDVTGMIKSNAWSLKCPSEVFAFDIVEWPRKQRWKWLRSLVEKSAVVAVPYRTKVLAVGTIDEIKTTFGDQLKGEIVRIPLCETDLTNPDGSVISLLKQAVIIAIADKLSLNTDKKYKLWEKDTHRSESHQGQYFKVHRCMEIDIRTVGGKQYLTIDPTFYIPNNSDTDDQATTQLKKRLIGYQHNDKYNFELDHWRNQMTKEKGATTFVFPPGSEAFKFELTNSPMFASIAKPNSPKYQVPDKHQNLIHHKGFVQMDPKLLFGRKNPSVALNPS